MKPNFFHDLLLVAATQGVNTLHIPYWIKILYTCFAGIVLILSGLNQWKTFLANYRTVWIVIKIEHVFKLISKKKNRHYKRKTRKNGHSTVHTDSL